LARVMGRGGGFHGCLADRCMTCGEQTIPGISSLSGYKGVGGVPSLPTENHGLAAHPFPFPPGSPMHGGADGPILGASRALGRRWQPCSSVPLVSDRVLVGLCSGTLAAAGALHQQPVSAVCALPYERRSASIGIQPLQLRVFPAHEGRATAPRRYAVRAFARNWPCMQRP
jgi:hypothetical protein